MIRTIEAVNDDSGQVRLAEPLRITGPHRALVTVLDEPPVGVLETALLSESALSDWSRPEEEEAWSHLQLVRSYWFRFRSLDCRLPSFVRPSYSPLRTIRIRPILGTCASKIATGASKATLTGVREM